MATHSLTTLDDSCRMYRNPITSMESQLINMQRCLLFLSGLAAFLGFVTAHDTALFNRSIFPEGFIFGTASSAYQYEGAANEGGKGPSIWDTFSHEYPDHIKDGSNGDLAVDSYHRYKEDIKIMAEMGVDAYRLSFSWSRILPGGRLSRGVNKEGIDYYNKLINTLLLNGINPSVTLFHWDTPQVLEDEYGGFLSPRIVDDFREYANFCFREFGDRVKHWITINEPWSFSTGGYAGGVLKLAPGRCSDWQKLDCKGGDSATEPYFVSHHQLLAHAAAVKLYREKYKPAQKGVIGIALMSFWMEPLGDDKNDHDAAHRALDFMFGWFMDPLTHGDYPDSMRSLAGSRLPEFSEKESEMVKGSIDFLGLNYYTTYYASDVPLIDTPPSFLTDSHAELTGERNGIPIGPQSASGWLYVHPQGFRELLLYTKEKYNNPVIYITENGVDEYNNDTISLHEALTDDMRIDYLYKHLSYLHGAMKDGVDVKGYFVWSLLDNFEWTAGYTSRFGLNYVDYKDGLKRYPKLSALWLRNFLKQDKKYRMSS